MNSLTKKEMESVLTIIKQPKTMFTANSLSKKTEISAMGSLKILNRLIEEEVIEKQQVGRAGIYNLIQSNYAKKYSTFLLSREAQLAKPVVKRWIKELRKLNGTQMTMLFGSILYKQKANDVDVLIITDSKNIRKLKSQVVDMNKMNVLQIHPIYQTYDDLIQNIEKKDPVILNAIQGTVVQGVDTFLEVYYESRRK